MTSNLSCSNPYLRNLSKIEFVITYACTGRCKHCSEGDHTADGTHIDPAAAAEAVRKIASAYDIQTVMTFGGEPLLSPDAVCAIMEAAKACNVPRRQIITNGFFSKDPDRIRAVTDRLAACGANHILLSVDAFHQETIPLDIVRMFAKAACASSIPLRLQPAWLVSDTDDNPYNLRTREILAAFSDLQLPIGSGNIIFPSGNALRYLSEYFRNGAPENPYIEDPRDVRCISFDPDGTVLGGNVYSTDILTLINRYHPETANSVTLIRR